MRWFSALLLASSSGFAVMFLEIVGARFLTRYFGSSHYVWTSQIGLVLVALTFGYMVGGWCADRWPRLRFLAWALAPAALFTALIPEFAPWLLERIIDRHPLDREIPAVWQRLDPALGSALLFLPPCFVLATVPPFLIRRTSRALHQVGRVSGAIYAAGSVGSIAGVFLSGYVVMDLIGLALTFRATGALMLLLAAVGWMADPLFRETQNASSTAD
jgi:MFS family permease